MAPDLKTECIKKLQALSHGITGVDKVEACEKLDISRPTLDKYLSGTVANIETAVSIIEFFSGIVANRIERLKKVA